MFGKGPRFFVCVQKLKKDGSAADFLFGRDWNMPMTHIGKRTRLFFGPMGRKLSVAVQSFSHVRKGFEFAKKVSCRVCIFMHTHFSHCVHDAGRLATRKLTLRDLPNSNIDIESEASTTNTDYSTRKPTQLLFENGTNLTRSGCGFEI